MRIISDHHDYYDSLMAYDADRELIYQRKAEEFEWPPNYWHEKDKSIPYPFPVCCDFPYYLYDNHMIVFQRIIGFCGRIYPTLFIERRGDPYGTPRTACHCIEDVDVFVKSKFDERVYEEYQAKKQGRNRWKAKFGKRYRLKQWFDEVELKKDSYKESIFEAKYCPVFVSWYTPTRTSIEYNACLKDTGFVKIFEPWKAYQEISMFLGSLAVPQKEIPKISDEDMVSIKGFDKHSFRKDPKR